MIIAFSGKIGSGKSTAADYLAETYGFEIINFADPLKEVVEKAFNVSHDYVSGKKEVRNLRDIPHSFWKDKLEYDKPREWLQQVGMTFRKKFHKDFWVFRLASMYSDLSAYNLVIGDARFKNEIDWIKSNKGIVVEIRRRKPDLHYKVAKFLNTRFPSKINFFLLTFYSKYSRIHISELAWCGLEDIVIENNGSIDDLYKNVDKLLTSPLH